MAGAVKDVQIDQIAITDTNLTNTASLGTQDFNDCVAFVTHRVTSGTLSSVESIQAAAFYTSGTVNVQRDSTAEDMEYEVSTVQFDDTRVRVQSGGPFEMDDSTTSDTTAIPIAVDLSNTFLICHSFQNSAAGQQYPSHNIRGRITGTQELTFDRIEDSGTTDIHWTVIESLSGDFTVTTSDVTLTGVASNTDTSFSVIKANTFVVGSWTSSDPNNDDNTTHTVDVTLDTGGQLTVQRVGTTGNIVWSGFLVKMADGTTVEHGTTVQATSLASEDETLATPVSLTRSIAIMSGNMGSTVCGSFTGEGLNPGQDAHVQLTLFDSDAGDDFDTVQLRHDTSGGTTGNDISWQVIEWGTSEPPSGATRRVMVIS
jgi:hypothetical protein